MAGRIRAIGAGAGVGLVLGGVLLAVASRAANQRPSCPSGWHEAPPPVLEGASGILACRPQPPEGTPPPLVALYRTAEPAASRAEPTLLAGARAVGALPPDGSFEGRPDHATADRAALSVLSHTLDVRELPLEADVYFIAAGRRFGLLTIVHTPESDFARPQATAEWMSTISGTAPWGAENAGALEAQCPQEFTALPPGGAHTIVRCTFGAGTSQFTTLSLTWDEGGFGREEDRAHVANAIAARVAQAQGAAARVVQPPVPFTLARNVDAIHTRVDTGERIPVSARVLTAYAPEGAPRVLGFAVSELDVSTVAALRTLFERGGYLASPGILPPLPLAALATVLLTLAGALLGAWFSRPGRTAGAIPPPPGE